MTKDVIITGDLNPIHLLLRLRTGGGWSSETVFLVDENEKQLTMENDDELVRR